ncbi:MAG: hypothetical protein WCG78_07880, partial [Candidatus Omnitrophota bacterium]
VKATRSYVRFGDSQRERGTLITMRWGRSYFEEQALHTDAGSAGSEHLDNEAGLMPEALEVESFVLRPMARDERPAIPNLSRIEMLFAYLTQEQRDFIVTGRYARLEYLGKAYRKLKKRAKEYGWSDKALINHVFKLADVQEAVDVLWAEHSQIGMDALPVTLVAERTFSFSRCKRASMPILMRRWLDEVKLEYDDFRMRPYAKKPGSASQTAFWVDGRSYSMPPLLAGKYQIVYSREGTRAKSIVLCGVDDPTVRLRVTRASSGMHLTFTGPVGGDRMSSRLPIDVNALGVETSVAFTAFMYSVLDIPLSFARTDETPSAREAAIRELLLAEGKARSFGRPKKETWTKNRPCRIGSFLLFFPSYYSGALDDFFSMSADNKSNGRRLLITDKQDQDNYTVLELRTSGSRVELIESRTGAVIVSRPLRGGSTRVNVEDIPSFARVSKLIDKRGKKIELRETERTNAASIVGFVKGRFAFWHDEPLYRYQLGVRSGKRARLRRHQSFVEANPLVVFNKKKTQATIRAVPISGGGHYFTIDGLVCARTGVSIKLMPGDVKKGALATFNLSVIADAIKPGGPLYGRVIADPAFQELFSYTHPPRNVRRAPRIRPYIFNVDDLTITPDRTSYLLADRPIDERMILRTRLGKRVELDFSLIMSGDDQLVASSVLRPVATEERREQSRESNQIQNRVPAMGSGSVVARYEGLYRATIFDAPYLSDKIVVMHGDGSRKWTTVQVREITDIPEHERLGVAQAFERWFTHTYDHPDVEHDDEVREYIEFLRGGVDAVSSRLIRRKIHRVYIAYDRYVRSGETCIDVEGFVQVRDDSAGTEGAPARLIDIWEISPENRDIDHDTWKGRGEIKENCRHIYVGSNLFTHVLNKQLKIAGAPVITELVTAPSGYPRMNETVPAQWRYIEEKSAAMVAMLLQAAERRDEGATQILNKVIVAPRLITARDDESDLSINAAVLRPMAIALRKRTLSYEVSSRSSLVVGPGEKLRPLARVERAGECRAGS